ncbi:dihydrolipoyl dehydrogenase family protein [Liquorilactobacillus capillatus]|uniref:Pyridine nucleotide-disulfide oxidoreductase n=1 Tax=Liquorilactobacillus capillatus DSM 19910 TaxID=1423731 RepID=A0A0R1M7Z9_9LACO|nr:NAD(P)/FAD-dependent oxidoreductase [Liquorilactobacillus capillatus]KRL00842.1 pyridine nucleotide-disulfide oxidoreductase [Liquorilactobacillus capillatus DSM 19910]
MEKKYDYDVLYLGSGHGAFDGAIPLASKGFKVAVIESGLIGGTCPNRGCNAKITLDAPVPLQRQVEDLQGIVTTPISLNWPKTVAHKHDVIKGLPDFIGGLLVDHGVTLLHGRGEFLDQHTLDVEGQHVTAAKIVIATGLRPHRLAIPGSELAHDSSEFMNLQELPAKIAIIGAGYVSLEFATIANAFGSEVTVLMHKEKALRRFYQPFVEHIITDLEKRGVQFIRNAGISHFKKDGTKTTIYYAENKNLSVDWILDASGRIPNVENLGLAKIGVEYDSAGIIVNDHLQTTVTNIYASGDVIKKEQPQLTPTAIFESTYLMHLFAGETSSPIDYPAIPSVVFTSPRIARVGVSVAEAENNPAYTVVKNNVLDNWYRQVTRETFGENALVFDKEHHLVGATEVSEHAEDVINSLLPAIELNLAPEQAERLIHLFPTISSASWELL